MVKNDTIIQKKEGLNEREKKNGRDKHNCWTLIQYNAFKIIII